jgi:ribulose 1,5-bisphosphate carboxylase large subunit-like protein
MYYLLFLPTSAVSAELNGTWTALQCNICNNIEEVTIERRRKMDLGGNCIMMNFIACILRRILLG